MVCMVYKNLKGVQETVKARVKTLRQVTGIKEVLARLGYME